MSRLILLLILPCFQCLDTTYDFIIVGAGSGGSVIANRLTEIRKWKVLLLEAGNEENFLSDVPLMAALHTSSSYNWGYKSVKMKTACLGLVDRRCNLPRGKALGGTSVINFLLYSRGATQDFDEWAQMGNKGWSAAEVHPYFLKSENCTKCWGIEKKYHGFGGPLDVETPPYESPLSEAFLKAGLELNYPVKDLNGENPSYGFSKVLATMRNGRRCSAAKAFLQPIMGRPNFHLSINSRVTKILIDVGTKRVTAVEFLKNRKHFKIKVTKEVVLSAGSFNSPQLLMLSGVGPQEHLEKIGIKVIQDLKVGYNLQDHLALSTLAFLVNAPITVSDRNVQNPVNIFNYIFNGRGPFTIPGGAEALGFVTTPLAKNNLSDIELVLGSGSLTGDAFGTLRALLNLPASVYSSIYAPWSPLPAFSIAPVLLRPLSRGRVLLKDRNPLHWPRIEPNYLHHDTDVRVMVEGVKLAVKITESSHFQRYNTTLNPLAMPQCENKIFGSDQYWACVVRHFATTLGHQVGTCKMGPRGDPSSVVDPELQVHGIEGLRVVDGSIMPNIVRGHTNSVIYMIGEKGADFIKKKWLGEK